MKFPINFFSRQHIERLQLRKIRRIVSHAYAHSTFYRTYYIANNFHPDQLKTYADIAKIPIVRRQDLKLAPTEQLVSTPTLNGLHLHTTSGSSGVSVRYYFTSREMWQKNYYVLRSYLMARMPWTAVTVALRDPIDITRPNILQRLGLFRIDYYNIYQPIEDIYRQLVDKYSGKTIPILKGYPSDLANLAAEVHKHGGAFPHVDIIYSDSEVLDRSVRQYVEQTFKCKVLDFYASVECGMIAFQTPDTDRYVINEDAVLLETVPRDGVQQVVITNLRNTTMPIIRYEIGDAIDSGNFEIDNITGLKTIKEVYGKYLDFILLPDKSIVSPHVPKQDLTHQQGVEKFKLVQETENEVVVYIQKNEQYTISCEQTLLEKLNTAFKGQIKIRIEYVDRLDREGHRKFKCIESKVAQQFISSR